MIQIQLNPYETEWLKGMMRKISDESPWGDDFIQSTRILKKIEWTLEDLNKCEGDEE